ncbi:MAG TPA: hypothetical protein VHB48_05290, partial [Chitinophagaceae bacterium]|nr:hypothetical protein [Chitinophagaceae bacterium]
CGFNIVHHTGIIEITNGCGVTSQGYLILKGAGKYAYVMPYAAPDQPTDLPFDYTGNLPFYKPFCQNKTVWLLLTDKEYDGLEDNKKPQAKTLSSQGNGFLNDYVVVLFLEASETDLKNCSAFDCTNKGEKMQFAVRPLLVAKKDLPDAVAAKEIHDKERLRFTELAVEAERARLSHQIMFKRYNVPYKALKSTTGVLNGFVKIVDDNTLREVANALIYTFEKYRALLNETTNPFANLFNVLKSLREKILKEYPIFIQYFYDFIDDLILAYYEFCVKGTGIVSQCCPGENLFPLHLVLGDAAKDTTAFVRDQWRNYFIYSPLFTHGNYEANEAKFLFKRMVLMVRDFEILDGAAARKNAEIRITPSQYGYLWLSQRAIPYYYHIANGDNAIYNFWDYYKTSHGNAVFNLSYNINLYNHSRAAREPLLFDIEHYNFFRIEGHIGQNYRNALDNVLKQRLEYNLPFDVVAISADMLRSDAKLPACNIQDLETDYKLILSEFACKVHTPFCFLTKFPYPPNAKVLAGDLKEGISMNRFSAYKMEAQQKFSGITGTIQSSGYKLGDFMRKYCLPENSETVGGYYLASLQRTERMYSSQADSVHQTSEESALSLIYDSIFGFIDAVEQLMLVLVTSTVATLDLDELQRRYEVYKRSTARLTIMLAELLSSGALKLSALMKALEVDILVDEFLMLSTTCIDERLQTLVEEYTRRLRLFQSQNSFINYYKKHPGLEHKAGVPKGGTFVMVYYTAEMHESVTLAGDAVLPNRKDAGIEEVQPVQSESIYMKVGTAEEKMIREFVNNCKDAPPEDKQKIIDIFTPRQTGTRFKLLEGEVIADFYIPYLCCSDCPPTAYIFPEKKETTPPADTPAINMDKAYCRDDEKPATITVSPAGGKITDANGDEVPGVEDVNGTFTFIPRKAGPGTFTLVYTVNGVASAPAKITVIDTPKASTFAFNSVMKSSNVFEVTFTPDIQESGFEYAWTFGAGFSRTSSAEQSPVVEASLDASGAAIETSVTLQVSNGKCP